MQLINDLHIVFEVANEVSLRAEATIEFLGQMTPFFGAHQLFLLLLIVVHRQDILDLIVNSCE